MCTPKKVTETGISTMSTQKKVGVIVFLVSLFDLLDMGISSQLLWPPKLLAYSLCDYLPYDTINISI